TGATGISGSLALTVWALDDTALPTVVISRLPVNDKEPPLVPVGTAVASKGSRPDIQQLFPNMPSADRAGWGSLLLTNFLPNGGVGTFTLVFELQDSAGVRRELGR